MNKLTVLAAFLIAAIGNALPSSAEVSAEMRRAIEVRAESVSVDNSVLREELRLTGFLDDQRTAEIVRHAAPAYALAWAALQSEEAAPGSAVKLLNSVAHGIASREADAIRYEPQFQPYFDGFAAGPIPAPTDRRFEFVRATIAPVDPASSLPAAAIELLEPLSKYAFAHPGGVHGLIVESLGLSPTESMDIERSAIDVAAALSLAVSKAPPPPEARYGDVLAALIAHGGEAVQLEKVVAAASRPRSSHGRPLIPDWRNDSAPPPNPALMAESSKIRAQVDAMVAAAFAGHSTSDVGPGQSAALNDPTGSDVAYIGAVGGAASAGGGGAGGRYSEAVSNLHTLTPVRLSEAPSFRAMRSIGGGGGSGGITVGADVESRVQGKPTLVSAVSVGGNRDLVVPAVVMSDGRVLFYHPVKPDLLVGAIRVVFGGGPKQLANANTGVTNSKGIVLVSLLQHGKFRRNVSAWEFLIHPGISDLAIGRELVICDGASFLFSDELLTVS